MSSIPNLNMNFSPARGVNFLRADTDVRSKYLEELLDERQKLVPFMHLLPICIRLINQEIIRVSGMISEQGNGDTDMNVEGKGYGGRNGNDLYNPLSEYWCCGPSSFVVKKALCLEIPVERYPNFNFIGRLLGPRGNSLKRVEASSGCRVFIRGKGSIKDSDKEELLRGKSGYEHLLDPLHILIEAEFPANIVHVRLEQAREIIEELLKPVDESQDMYKKQQLRELAMLNNSLKESSPQTKGIINLHPLNSSGMKRAKTAG